MLDSLTLKQSFCTLYLENDAPAVENTLGVLIVKSGAISITWGDKQTR